MKVLEEKKEYLRILAALNNKRIRYITAFNGNFSIDKDTTNIEDLIRELTQKQNEQHNH
jgi:hypothetical protein